MMFGKLVTFDVSYLCVISNIGTLVLSKMTIYDRWTEKQKFMYPSVVK